MDEYCRFVREQTDLRLGIEADFIPGAEDRMANLIAARDFDYVVGSVHFIAREGLDMDDYSIWDGATSAEAIWRRYFEVLGQAARSGLFDILAHPDLVKMWGREPTCARQETSVATTSSRSTAIAESGIAIEVSTAGLRKCAREMYPAPAFLEMCVEAGAPVTLSSDAHVPADIGAGYEQALELLERVGVTELCAFSSRERTLHDDRRERHVSLVGIGYDSHRLADGLRLVIGGVEIRPDCGLEGHSDADVLTHAVIDALLGAAGLGDIGERFPDADERYRGADSIELLREVVQVLGAEACAGQRGLHRDYGAAEDRGLQAANQKPVSRRRSPCRRTG